MVLAAVCDPHPFGCFYTLSRQDLRLSAAISNAVVDLVPFPLVALAVLAACISYLARYKTATCWCAVLCCLVSSSPPLLSPFASGTIRFIDAFDNTGLSLQPFPFFL